MVNDKLVKILKTDKLRLRAFAKSGENNALVLKRFLVYFLENKRAIIVPCNYPESYRSVKGTTMLIPVELHTQLNLVKLGTEGFIWTINRIISFYYCKNNITL